MRYSSMSDALADQQAKSGPRPLVCQLRRYWLKQHVWVVIVEETMIGSQEYQAEVSGPEGGRGYRACIWLADYMCGKAHVLKILR